MTAGREAPQRLPISYNVDAVGRVRAYLVLHNAAVIHGPWSMTRAETTRALGDFCQWFADDGVGAMWAAVARACWSEAERVRGLHSV